MAPRARGGSVGQLVWRAKGLVTRTRERVTETMRAAPDVLQLEDVRRRLELMLYALHGRPVRVSETPAPAERTLTDRVTGLFTPRHLLGQPIAFTDGDAVLLPPRLSLPRHDPAGMAHYRLLALVQAERITRGTAAVLQHVTEPLARDLFLLRESMAVEARLTRDVSSVRGTLAEARREALAMRPELRALSMTERAVEALVRSALEPQASLMDATLADSTPADSLAWARTTSASIREDARYRGSAPVAHWGAVTPRVVSPDARSASASEPPRGNPNAPRDGAYKFEARTVESGGEGAETDSADPDREGDAVEDARGTLTQTDDGGGAPDASRDTDDSARPPNPDGLPDDEGPAVRYPEWNDDEKRYRRDAVMVRERLSPEADSTWAADTLRQNAAIIRRIRERFEPLRAQRLRLNQQREGEELDLQACIQAIVDARTGHTPSDRLYASVRPARRSMTICLLVDVSASTESPLPHGERIVDVERQATLYASEAFDVLGDPYALLTFSSRGSRNVCVGTLKDFDERNGTSVRQRIAGIEPGDNTRLGAAIRHAAARLSLQPAGRPLLLILSDGKPNDFDGYYEAAGIEDSRQAINDARALGIFPYCITIDREDGPEYLPRIFGATGYTVIREPSQLPLALVRVVRQLLSR